MWRSSQAWPEPNWASVRKTIEELAPGEASALAAAAALLATDSRFPNAESVDGELASAVAALRTGRQVGEDAACQAGRAAERWDEQAFGLREEAENQGDLTGGMAYREAFAAARAAASVEAALRGDALRAVYEARHAVDDEQNLLATLAAHSALSG